MWDIFCSAKGRPRLRETLTELKEVVRQIASESVQQHPKLVEVLRAKELKLCGTLVQIADKEVPEASIIIKQLIHCDRILKEYGKSDWRIKAGQAAELSPASAAPKPGHLPRSPAQAAMPDATGSVSTTGVKGTERTRGQGRRECTPIATSERCKSTISHWSHSPDWIFVEWRHALGQAKSSLDALSA
ncbi:hypothetical protein CVIRNUC_009809 [Coccomyxa viridis]|uniref:Uncharacterized protein n=1 Tax=Coccomyxa viridis TaxID=1274662 RepID=A0AAV1IJH6_9CHLO|nr:hypothetical protein CVIRNUC_009809 [Coccomyxa viridis]